MKLPLIDMLGHFFLLFMLLGKWQVAHKRRSGWLYWAFGATGLIVVGYSLGMTSFVLWNALYVCFYLYSWRLWGKDVKNV